VYSGFQKHHNKTSKHTSDATARTAEGHMFLSVFFVRMSEFLAERGTKLNFVIHFYLYILPFFNSIALHFTKKPIESSLYVTPGLIASNP
jgi:hypothetical protein